jgi:hypothetical protein
MITRWVIAGTPIDEPYPCRCQAEFHFLQPHPCHPKDCAGVGRTDLDAVTPGCCAVRYAARASR